MVCSHIVQPLQSLASPDRKEWKCSKSIKTQNLHFRVRPWLLLTILNFSNGGRQMQRHFNVSFPSTLVAETISFGKSFILENWKVA